jgi:Fic family protein
MIFKTPTASKALARRLAELDRLRTHMSDRTGAGAAAMRPWLGRLRRQWRASSASSSIAIEGFHVTPEQAVAVIGGEATPDLADEDRMALQCYARAMDHAGVMAGDPGFRWSERVVLDLHYDACWFQREKGPGRYRKRGVEVTGPGGGLPAYVGPPAGEVPGLMGEVVAWLDRADGGGGGGGGSGSGSGGGNGDANGGGHVVVRAAMAHLHVVSVHPFSDGNGRVARIVQSLVLARGGLLAPELVSIEEYLGVNTGAYYATLQRVQGGSYQPERDATPWVKFCVEAHIEQARRRLEQLAQAGRRWSYLEGLVERRGWPERMAIALEQSLFGGTDRVSYTAEAGVSAPTASNDLRRMVDAGLVVRRGRGRSTRYLASDGLREGVRGAAT